MKTFLKTFVLLFSLTLFSVASSAQSGEPIEACFQEYTKAIFKNGGDKIIEQIPRYRLNCFKIYDDVIVMTPNRGKNRTYKIESRENITLDGELYFLFEATMYGRQYQILIAQDLSQIAINDIWKNKVHWYFNYIHPEDLFPLS